MVVFKPEPLILEDERSKALLFTLIAQGDYASFDFAAMLQVWFNGDKAQLAKFLNWLDGHDLEIRKKQ